jgi:diadenosine tetraphosphatase ApaH/serine/threonine PP2A family protein phosphatase
VLACLYDVHGNLSALEAVLADAESAGAASFALGGDYAAFGPEPEACVERLDGLDAEVRLAGNWERWAAGADDLPDNEVVLAAADAVREALGPEVIAAQAALAWRGSAGGATLVHASPVSDVRSFAPEPGEEDEELLGDAGGPRLIFGHTHLAFRRSGPGGIELVNPGSVGLPLDGDPRAAYLLVHDDGRLEHRRVGYDHQSVAAALRARYGPGWADTVAGRIERAAW